jgi:acyl-CoA 6-desaturase (Delta-6 desaturase)
MNINPGPLCFVSWWMGYLNFQIEHHLFPCMPQFRHSVISPRVKKFFEDHGFKYDQRDFFDALDCTFKNLDQVGVEVFLG